ncbi:MAG: hypothetical protein KDA96_14165 [Planctomycetaceae bacterium]|nr:hypothetical protein [Planctomycetaceae bacterium]
MNQKTVQPRVKGGVPVWAWGVLIVVGLVAVIGILREVKSVDPTAVFERGVAAFKTQDRDGVVKAAEALDGMDAPAEAKQIMEGLRWIALERPLKALKPLEEAAKSPQYRLQAMTYLGIAHKDAAERFPAIEILTEVLKEEPDNGQALETLATIYWELAALDKANETLNRMIDLKHALTNAYRVSARIHYDRHHLAEAAEMYRAAIEVDPTSPLNGAAAARLIECLYWTGKPEEISKYVGIADMDPTVRAIQAEEELKEKGVDAALKVLQPVIDSQQFDAFAMVTFARLSAEQGPDKLAEAIGYMRFATPRFNREPLFYRGLAELADKAGERELADACRQNASQLDQLAEEFQVAVDELAAADIDDIEIRMKTAEMAGQLNRLELARSFYAAARNIDHSIEAELGERLARASVIKPELVSTKDLAPSFPVVALPSTQLEAESLEMAVPQADETPATQGEPASGPGSSDGSPEGDQ